LGTASASFIANVGSGRSSPQDVHGHSEDEAEEVTDEYLKTTFSLDEGQVAEMRRAPKAWKLITRR
jgi:hypothetical protein